MSQRSRHANWCWGPYAAKRRGVAGRLDAVGWGAFFIWIGVALLADVGWGKALLGIGLIILGGQAARWVLRLGLEGFWLLAGTAFVFGGVWQLLDSTLPLLPVLLVLVGVALVLTGFLSWRGGDAPPG